MPDSVLFSCEFEKRLVVVDRTLTYVTEQCNSGHYWTLVDISGIFIAPSIQLYQIIVKIGEIQIHKQVTLILVRFHIGIWHS